MNEKWGLLSFTPENLFNKNLFNEKLFDKKLFNKFKAVFVALVLLISALPVDLAVDVFAAELSPVVSVDGIASISPDINVNHEYYNFVLETNYRYLPHVALELRNNTTEAMEYLEAHFEVYVDGYYVEDNSPAFQVLRGFSPGYDGTPYNSHNTLPANLPGEVPVVNVRISPRAGLSGGTSYENVLVISRGGVSGGRIELARIPLGVAVGIHPGIRPSLWTVPFGTVEAGFSHALTVNVANGAGPRQINLRNMSTLTPVYIREEVPSSLTGYGDYILDFIFGLGDDSPFFIYRGVRAGTSATYATGPLTDTIPATNANSANIRVGVRRDFVLPSYIPAGGITFTDTLRIVGPDGRRWLEQTTAGADRDILLTVTVLPWAGDRVSLPSGIGYPDVFIFPNRPVDYPAFGTAAILATTYNPASNNARQFNLTNLSSVTITGVSRTNVMLDGGADSPFNVVMPNEPYSMRLGTGVGVSATTNRPLDYIPPHGVANVRVRPNPGLPIGVHTDILRIVSGNGTLLAAIPLSFTVVSREDIGFELMVRATRFPGIADDNFLLNPTSFSSQTTTNPLVFPDRQLGYIPFTTTMSVSGSSGPFTHRSVFITNLSTDFAIDGLTASWASESGNGGLSPFMLTRDLHRSTGVIAITNAAPSSRLEPNNAAASLAAGTINVTIAPRNGLLSGEYNDVLQIRGDHYFALDIPVRFTVVGPTGVRITPENHSFGSRQVGYAFAAATGGGREFLVGNYSEHNHTYLRVEWETGGIFTLQRNFTRQNSTNHHGSTAVHRTLNSRIHSNSSNPHVLGVRVWPVNGLDVGVHTDYMIIMARARDCTASIYSEFNFVELTRARLSFEVLPPPSGWPSDFIVQPNASWTFTSRMVGYTIPDNNTGWVQFVFRNLRVGSAVPDRITGLEARLERGAGSPFAIHRPLSSTQINGGGTANIQIWPRVGLPPGTHTDALILTGVRGDGEIINVRIPLSFRVYQPDFSVRTFGRIYSEADARTNRTYFDWHPRYYGIGRGTTVWPQIAETLTQTFRPVEFLFTNHTGANVTITTTDIAGAITNNLFNTPHFTINRSVRYHTLENADVTTTATTTILAGATVGIRLIPSADLPVGNHNDVFTLRDINGVPLASIDLNVHIMDWSDMYVTPRFPDAGTPAHIWPGHIAGTALNDVRSALPVFELPSQNQGYTMPDISLSLLNLQVPVGYYTPSHRTWGSFPLGVPSGNISIYFYDGPTGLGWDGFQTGQSRYFELYWTALSGATVANSPRHVASIRPRLGLPVGIYEDVLVFRSRVIDYNEGIMDAQRFIIYVPVRFEVLPHNIGIYPPLDTLPQQPGDHPDAVRVRYVFPNMPRGYTILEQHAANLSFKNFGTSAIEGITAEFLPAESSLHGGQIPFSIMDPPGFTSTVPQSPGATSHILAPYPTGYLGISVWPRNMLPPGQYYTVLHITNGSDFNVFVHFYFLVDYHDISFPEPLVFDPVFVGYQPAEFQRMVVELENFGYMGTISGINVSALVNSPFIIEEISRYDDEGNNILPWNAISPGDTIRITISLNGLYPGLTDYVRIHQDNLFISGPQGLVRNVPISFAVHEVTAEVTAPGIGITEHTDLVAIPPRHYGYATIPPVGIRFRNNSPIPFTNLSPGELLGAGDFEIVTHLQVRDILPGEYGVIYVRPVTGLPIGSYYDTIIFEGDLGFVLEIDINFGVFDFIVRVPGYPVPDAPPRLVDPLWIQDHRFMMNPGHEVPDLTRIEGYTSVDSVPFEAVLFSPVRFNNFSARIEGTNADAFYIVDANNLFPAYWSEDEEAVIQVLPFIGLGIGVYNAELIIYLDGYGDLQRIPLRFDVVARAQDTVSEGDGEFGTRVVGYYDVPHNRITFWNLGTADIRGLRSYIRLPDGSEIPASTSIPHEESAFEIVTDVHNRLDGSNSMLGTVWGGWCGCATSDIDIRPRTGLPVGTYHEHLVVRGYVFPFRGMEEEDPYSEDLIYFIIPLNFIVTPALAPEIYPLLENITVTVGYSGATIERDVTVIAPDPGNFSFQWQMAGSYDGPFADIPNANNAVFDAPIDTLGRIYYRVIVTNTWIEASEERSVSTKSNAAYVEVIDFVDAETPIIITHPQDATVNVNVPVILTVVASVNDGGILSYQWYVETVFNSGVFEAILNETDSNISVDTSEVGQRRYRVVVTNYLAEATGERSASETSDIATVTVNILTNAPMPVIIQHPQGFVETVGDVGDYVTLTVLVTEPENGDLSFQWQSAATIGGVFQDIDGETNESFNAPICTVGVIYYRVVVTNTWADATGNQAATATSNVARGEVIDLSHAPVPVITEHPQSYSVTVRPLGEMHQLLVAVTPPINGELTFQWRSAVNADGPFTDVLGETSSTLDVPIDVVGERFFKVVVTNTWADATGNKTESVTSNVAYVKVVPQIPTTVIVDPETITLQQGETHNFTAEVLDQDGNLYRGNTNIIWSLSEGTAASIAAGTSYTNGEVQISADQPIGTLILKAVSEAVSEAAPVVYDTATIIVTTALAAPFFITPPESITVYENEDATFSVVVGGYPVPTLQWRKFPPGVLWPPITIDGATSNTLTLSGVTLDMSGYSFHVVATNSQGEAISFPNAILTVKTPTSAQTPEITEHPQTVTINIDQNIAVNLTVGANVSDGGTLSFQWYVSTLPSISGGERIDGATHSSFSPPIDTIGRLWYFVVITNTLKNSGGDVIATAYTVSDFAMVDVYDGGIWWPPLPGPESESEPESGSEPESESETIEPETIEPETMEPEKIEPEKIEPETIEPESELNPEII